MSCNPAYNKSINYAPSAPDAAKLRRLLKRYMPLLTMTQNLKIIFTTLGFIAFFFAGAFWQKWQLLESGAFKLTKPLKLHASPDTTGTLPAGTTLYQYASAGETETFVIFLQMKNLGLLKPHNFDNQLTVDPIDGYLE